MASSRRELVVAIVSDASQFNRGFDQASRGVKTFGTDFDTASKGITGKVSGLSASFKGLALTAASAFGAGQLAGFAQDSIAAFSDLDESLNAVEVTFGSAADEIKQLGEEAATQLGVSNSEFNSLAVSFAGFAEDIAGEGGNVAGTIDEMTTRIGDFASVMNLDFNDAADKFRSGLAGETEPLRKFGLDVSAAAVTTKALELGLADSSAELTEQDKILARYKLIMEQTDKVAGDFLATSDGLANSQRILAARFEDMKASVGESLAPLMESLLEVGEGLIPVFEDFAVSLADTVAAFGPLIDFVAQAVEKFGEFRATAEDALGSDSPIDQFFGRMQLLLTSGALPGLVDLIQDAFGGAGEASENASVKLEQSRDKLEQVWKEASYVPGPVEDAGEAIAGAGDEASDTATALRDLRSAFLEAADPAFAAAAAVDRMRDAEQNLRDVRKDEESTRRDIINAQLDYAEAVLEAQGALDAFSAADAEAAIDAIASALGISRDKARELLDELDILDGKVINVTVDIAQVTHGWTGTGGGVGGLVEGLARGGSFDPHQPIMVGEEGPELLFPQAAGRIIPNHQIGGFGSQWNLNVNVEGDVSDRNLQQIQTELILSSVSRWAENH